MTRTQFHDGCCCAGFHNPEVKAPKSNRFCCSRRWLGHCQGTVYVLNSQNSLMSQYVLFRRNVGWLCCERGSQNMEMLRPTRFLPIRVELPSHHQQWARNPLRTSCVLLDCNNTSFLSYNQTTFDHMFIALIGTRFSGKSTVKDFLANQRGFTPVRLLSRNVCQRPI